MAAASNGMPFRIDQRYQAWLLFFGLLAMAWVPGPLSATETASFQIKHISLEEAKGLAQIQLSPDGRLSTLPSRSLLIAVDNQENIEKVHSLLQQFDVPAPRMLLNLQVLAVSRVQSRLWAAEGQQLPGGWKLITNPGSIKHRLMATRETWLRPGTGIRIETGGVRPIRPEIRDWLEQHGVPDSPDLALHPITTGLTFRASLQQTNQVRLELSPWIKLTQQPQVTAPAHVEILPDLGTTAVPLQPPSTIAPIRLNIQPDGNASTPRYIDIIGANTEIDIPVGEPLTLLASEKQARALGDALLSKTINGQGKLIVFRLLLKQAP